MFEILCVFSIERKEPSLIENRNYSAQLKKKKTGIHLSKFGKKELYYVQYSYFLLSRI